jgi:hypothetical protein
VQACKSLHDGDTTSSAIVAVVFCLLLQQTATMLSLLLTAALAATSEALFSSLRVTGQQQAQTGRQLSQCNLRQVSARPISDRRL